MSSIYKRRSLNVSRETLDSTTSSAAANKRRSLNMSRDTLDSTKTSESHKRRSLASSRDTLDSRTMSIDSLGSIMSKPSTLKDEIDNIRDSLDFIKSSILSQQFEIARDFEDRVRQTYDGVINDLNEVRKKVNTLGDEVAADKKFKKWAPSAPFRKEVLQNIYEIRKPSKLTSSKSVDFVDSCEKDKSNMDTQKNNYISGFVGQGRFSTGKLKMASSTDLHKSRVGTSKTSLNSRFDSTTSLNRNKSTSGSTTSISGSRSQVPGFGCCFTGDNKTYPYRTYRAKYYSFYRYQRPGHSWGPSRSGSRSTLDDDDWWDDDKGVMCGTMPDDWRVRVAPYMWEGWPLPGLDKMDVGRLRERLQKFDEIRDDLVDVQNEYRSKHGCPALTVTKQLSRDAQEWAEVLAMKGYAQYSDSQSRGENILVIDIENELAGRQVIDTWYRESLDFNYKHPGWQRGTSNFTQMIWKSSKAVGVGIAKFPHADTYVVVVQYKPAGNVNAPGQFRLNVPVQKFDHTSESHKDPVPKFDDMAESHNIPELDRAPTEHPTKTIDQRLASQHTSDSESNETDNSHAHFVGKEEIAHDEQCLLFPLKYAITDRMKEMKLQGSKESACDYTKLKDTVELSEKASIGKEESDNLENIECIFDDDSNSSSSGSSYIYVNTVDDVLISFDDNQEEIFKEELIGRGFLGKQIVDEMIRDLVNERIEFGTLHGELVEYGTEPKRLAFETQSSVSASIEQDDDYMSPIDGIGSECVGEIDDDIADIGIDVDPIGVIESENDNDIADIACDGDSVRVIKSENDDYNDDDDDDDDDDIENGFERQSSVSASIEQEGDILLSIDDVDSDYVDDSVHDGVEHMATALVGDIDSECVEDIVHENIAFVSMDDSTTERMNAIADYFKSQSNVSEIIKQDGDDVPIHAESNERTGEAVGQNEAFVEIEHETGDVPIHAMSNEMAGESSREASVGIEDGIGDAERKKELNRKFVVRINSHSDKISDV